MKEKDGCGDTPTLSSSENEFLCVSLLEEAAREQAGTCLQVSGGRHGEKCETSERDLRGDSTAS